MLVLAEKLDAQNNRQSVKQSEYNDFYMSTLSVIILSYNTKKLTYFCIDSLVKSLAPTTQFLFEIIVIDNASTDGSVDMLKKMKQEIENLYSHISYRFIFNKVNVGFPKGNNQGLKIVHGEFVLFLNSDVIIKKINFKQLFSYLHSRPEIGVLTVKVMLPTQKIDPASHRGFPTIWNAACYFLKFEKIFGRLPLLNRLFGGYHLTYKDIQSIHEIDSPSGAFYLTRNDIMKKVHGFDEAYFMYGEDLDLSYRIKRLGYKVMYYPLESVIHFKSASGLKHKNKEYRKNIQIHFYEAMKIFYKKHYEIIYPKIITKLVYLFIEIKKYFS